MGGVWPIRAYTRGKIRWYHHGIAARKGTKQHNTKYFIPQLNKVYEGFVTFSVILFNDNFTPCFFSQIKTTLIELYFTHFHFFSLQFLRSVILFLFFSR